MRITETHAEESKRIVLANDTSIRAKKQVIGETDGCFIQIVETGHDIEGFQGDCRKQKKLGYREARLSLAYAQGSKDIQYAGTFHSVHMAGEQLSACVSRVGCDEYTRVHCVGDGARWIANQVDNQFGANGTYLIDFYHLCDYLSAAASSCAPNKEKKWLNRQKNCLKAGDTKKVLAELQKHNEPSNVPEEEAPVRRCLRYIQNRINHLFYKEAIEKNLPIGSGAVESAHRYVAQKRLKLPGAAWKFNTADDILNLRVLRANNMWGRYWAKFVA